ncbi:MAG TPA: methionyl-tRNA formyltransferase [Acidimicrobiia bacterium]|nr:methionyl-tRNA formyltransferase [Acidimicrobiia bacterium]
MARVVFLGTPEAAVPTLEHLVGEHDVALVVTQPDKARGRSGTPTAPPVKTAADRLGIPVAQPESATALLAAVDEHGPYDIGVVVAYGRILRPEVLDIPENGMINLHFSLLPRWRGAAPVARAIMAGDPMTGVTIMRLDEGLDTGPILTAQAVDILDHEDAGALTTRLAELGTRLLASTLPAYLSGDIEAVEQSDEGLTYAEKIEKSDRPIDIGGDPLEAVHRVRALAPSPAATLSIDGERHKIFAARPVEAHLEPGTWAAVGGIPLAGLAGGAIELIRIQPPGKVAMSGSDWVNGRQDDHGEID